MYMAEDNRDTLIDIRERLVRIETILQNQDFESIKEIALDAKTASDKNSKDIAELQSYVKWFVMAIIGAFLASLCAIVFK